MRRINRYDLLQVTNVTIWIGKPTNFGLLGCYVDEYLLTIF